MRRLRSVARKARLLNVEEVRRKELHVFIDEIQHGVMQVHDEIAKSYFLSQYDTSQTQTQTQAG